MDTNEIVIERVTDFSSEIADAIRSLVEQIGDNYQPLTDDDVKEMIENPQSFLLIAKHVPTGKIAGMVMTMIYRIPYTKKAYIDDIVVDEKFRKLGIATKLLETAIEIARKHHAGYIMLTAHHKRIAGNRLYEKLGFQKRESNIYRLEL